mgnify:CR=1 FL=1
MNDLNQKLLELNEEIVNTFSSISDIKPRAWHVFLNSDHQKLEDILLSYRRRIDEIDREIEPHTIIPQDFNGIQMASGKLTMLFSTRNMALTSLGEAQKILSNSQSLASFEFTTTISLLAIVISIIGVAN